MGTPRQDILEGPMKLEKSTGIHKVNAVFVNFVYYFRHIAKGWRYESALFPNPQKTGQQVLDGESSSGAYCVNMMQAFMELVKEAFGSTPLLPGNRVAKNMVLMTPHLSSLLPDLAYNVRLPHNSCADQQQYLFAMGHEYCKIASRYYDPLFGVSGKSEHFQIDHWEFHTVSRVDYPNLAGKFEEADALIPQRQPDVIYRATGGKGTRPEYVRLTPKNLGKEALADLLEFYKENGLPQWRTKYKNAKPSMNPFI